MNIFHARCYVAYEPNSVIVDAVIWFRLNYDMIIIMNIYLHRFSYENSVYSFSLSDALVCIPASCWWYYDTDQLNVTWTSCRQGATGVGWCCETDEFGIIFVCAGCYGVMMWDWWMWNYLCVCRVLCGDVKLRNVKLFMCVQGVWWCEADKCRIICVCARCCVVNEVKLMNVELLVCAKCCVVMWDWWMWNCLCVQGAVWWCETDECGIICVCTRCYVVMWDWWMRNYLCMGKVLCGITIKTKMDGWYMMDCVQAMCCVVMQTSLNSAWQQSGFLMTLSRNMECQSHW